jgi:hypothetical protein
MSELSLNKKQDHNKVIETMTLQNYSCALFCSIVRSNFCKLVSFSPQWQCWVDSLQVRLGFIWMDTEQLILEHKESTSYTQEFVCALYSLQERIMGPLLYLDGIDSERYTQQEDQ